MLYCTLLNLEQNQTVHSQETWNKSWWSQTLIVFFVLFLKSKHHEAQHYFMRKKKEDKVRRKTQIITIFQHFIHTIKIDNDIVATPGTHPVDILFAIPQVRLPGGGQIWPRLLSYKEYAKRGFFYYFFKGEIVRVKTKIKTKLLLGQNGVFVCVFGEECAPPVRNVTGCSSA